MGAVIEGNLPKVLKMIQDGSLTYPKADTLDMYSKEEYNLRKEPE